MVVKKWSHDNQYARHKILSFIQEYLEGVNYQIGPTQKEIAEAVGITPQAVGYHIRKMKNEGVFVLSKHEKIRGIIGIRRETVLLDTVEE